MRSRGYTLPRMETATDIVQALSGVFTVYLVGLIVVPVALLVVNLIVRGFQTISTGADTLMLLISLDVAILMQPREYAQIVRNPMLVEAITPMHWFMFWIAVVWWLLVVRRLEPQLVTLAAKARAGLFPGFGYVVGTLFCWAVPVTLGLLHFVFLMSKSSE
jgi:hypothetical protein